MKRICSHSGRFFLAFVLCVMTHACVTTQANVTPPGPLMVLKETTFDFKEVKEGARVQHSFRVLNQGDQPLRIKRVEPG